MKDLRKHWIYKIVSPSGKVYIGQTTNLTRRTAEYRRCKCDQQPGIYRSIKKYGWESHAISVLFVGECSLSTINELEIEYIYVFRSFVSGLNMSMGGLGGLGNPMSEENKLAMSRRRKGAIASEETRKRMSIAGKGKKKPPGMGEKVSLKRTGMKLSEATKAKLKLVNLGRPAFNRSAVIDMETNKQYHSAKEASSCLGIKYSTLRGILLDPRNLRFKYTSPTKRNNPKTKPVLCVKTGIRFESAKQCADYLQIPYSTMRSFLNGRIKNTTTFLYET